MPFIQASGTRVAIATLVALMAGSLAHAGIQEGAPADAGTVALQRIDVTGLPEVEVYFTVVDGTGHSVLGLTPAEIGVRIDGGEQPISVLRSALAGGQNLAVAFLFDRSGSMKSGFESAREAALDFLGRLSDGDQVAIVGFDDVVAIQQSLTSDIGTAEAALLALERGADTAIYDAVVVAVEQLAGAPTDRRAIVVLSDGRDTDSKATIDEAIAAARDASVPIYALGLPVDSDEEALARMSRETGGSYRQAAAPDEIRMLYQSIAEELANQYQLIFSLSGGADESWHDMQLVYARAAGDSWQAERGFVASLGPGVTRERVRGMQRDVATRGIRRAALLGAALGFVGSLLLLLILRLARPNRPLGIVLSLALVLTAVVLGATVSTLLLLTPGR